MIKRVAIISLPDGANAEEFWKYWIEEHAADVKKSAGPRLKKYVINRVVKPLVGQQKFWGLVETWWENEEAMDEAAENRKSMESSRGKTILEDFQSKIADRFSAIVEEVEIPV